MAAAGAAPTTAAGCLINVWTSTQIQTQAFVNTKPDSIRRFFNILQFCGSLTQL